MPSRPTRRVTNDVTPQRQADERNAWYAQRGQSTPRPIARYNLLLEFNRPQHQVTWTMRPQDSRCRAAISSDACMAISRISATLATAALRQTLAGHYWRCLKMEQACSLASAKGKPAGDALADRDPQTDGDPSGRPVLLWIMPREGRCSLLGQLRSLSKRADANVYIHTSPSDNKQHRKVTDGGSTTLVRDAKQYR